MNFNDDTSDDSIIISQDHEQTPVGTSVAALGTSAAAALASLLNQMTPEELSHLKRQVYKYIKFDRDWKKVQSILKKYPDMVHIPLFTGRASTAFHEAVNVRNAGIVEGLVNLMTPEDLLIPYSDGLLPVHVAALFGHRTIVQFLSSENLLNLMAPKGIEQLFFISMESNMFVQGS